MRFIKLNLVRISVLAFGILILSTVAQAANWTAARSSKGVEKLVSGGQWVAVKKGTTLKPGETIRTGKFGRIVLQRNEETMALGPNAVVTLPVIGNYGGKTSVHQISGEVTYEVERRNVKHFAVDTPYLAAVVKGTKFMVKVGKVSSSVSVHRGSVEVSDYDTGEFALINKGDSARTRNQQGVGLSVNTGTKKLVKTKKKIISPAMKSVSKAAATNKSNKAIASNLTETSKRSNNGKGNGNSNAGGNPKGKGNGNSNAGGNPKGKGNGYGQSSG